MTALYDPRTGRFLAVTPATIIGRLVRTAIAAAVVAGAVGSVGAVAILAAHPSTAGGPR